MDRYTTMVNVVRSGAFEQQTGIDQIAQWVMMYKRLMYTREEEFDHDVNKMIQTEGVLYDGLDEELLRDLESPDTLNENQLSLLMPLLDHGDHAELIPDESSPRYHRGHISEVRWDFSMQRWEYKLAGDDAWHAEKTIRKQAESGSRGI